MKTAAAVIREDIALHRAELDALTTSLVEEGIGIWSDGEGGADGCQESHPGILRFTFCRPTMPGRDNPFRGNRIFG